jgi:hypothetical protein
MFLVMFSWVQVPNESDGRGGHLGARKAQDGAGPPGHHSDYQHNIIIIITTSSTLRNIIDVAY